jgi:hypothetical protein
MHAIPIASKTLPAFISYCTFVRHFLAIRRLCIESIAVTATIAAFTFPALAMDLKDQLVGVWRYQDQRFSSELIIHQDGRFSKHDMGSGHQTMISGSIKVFPNPQTLRLIIRDYAPKQWCGPLGCKQIQMIAAEMYRFKVNQHELLLWDKNGRWLYKRVR